VSLISSCSLTRQTEPVTDILGLTSAMVTPESEVFSSIPRNPAIADRISPAESGRRLGCLRRYYITASAIGAGTSGLASISGFGLSLSWDCIRGRMPASRASGKA
jgi:hypothetical protein